MKKIPYWTRKLMETKATKQIKKEYEGSTTQLEEIKSVIANYIENKPDKEQFNAVIIVCAEIISGFEQKEHQLFIIDMIKKLLQNLEE